MAKHKKQVQFAPAKLLLRCYADRQGDTWQAFCIDLNLAAQGDTFKEVRYKLHLQIDEYVNDALTGEDREYADQLLNRPAPFAIRAKYYYLKVLFLIKAVHNDICRLFTEVMPLTPSRV